MPVRTKSYRIQAAGCSDVGLVRENNEDAWFVDPKSNIFVLADGMGGHNAGEVAAQKAVLSFQQKIHALLPSASSLDADGAVYAIDHVIREVNHEVHTLSRKDRDLRGMGTTLCCAYFLGGKMVVGHVGDSRVYHYRGGRLKQVTEDHTLLSELIELGELNKRQAEEYPHKHIITKAIGAEAHVQPDVSAVDIRPGDKILMCSDGLSDLISKEEIEAVINDNTSLEETVQALIDSAKRRGGHDNITVVIMQVLKRDEKPYLPGS